ncbi:MAG: gerAC [Firmicutes bacterium]|nr:gerAC [Bacillota bacterium]
MLTRRPLRTWLLFGVMLVLNFFITGCWDRKEIEDRGFALGVGIDHVVTTQPKGQYDLPSVTQEFGERKYQVTFELPRFRKGEEKSGGGTESHYIFMGEGESMFQIVRAISAKTYFSLFFEETQVLIFSEAVAKEGISEILDYFLRNPGMRRKVGLFVTPGRAEDILTGKLKVEDVNSIFVSKILKNVNINPRFASLTNLGDIAEAIRGKKSFVMAEVVLENGEIKVTKTAIFNNQGKMIGEADEQEVVGGRLIRKKLKEGVISIANPANPEKLAAFEIVEAKTSVSSHLEGGRLWFTLEADFAGNLGENTEIDQKTLDPTFLSAVEEQLAAELTREVLAIYHKEQALQVEVFDLGALVRRKNYC